MKNANMDHVLDKAMQDFTDAYERLRITVERYKATKGIVDEELEVVKHFKAFHDDIAGVEEYYDDMYTVEFSGHTVKLPFTADVWECINDALKTTIENW